MKKAMRYQQELTVLINQIIKHYELSGKDYLSGIKYGDYFELKAKSSSFAKLGKTTKGTVTYNVEINESALNELLQSESEEALKIKSTDVPGKKSLEFSKNFEEFTKKFNYNFNIFYRLHVNKQRKKDKIKLEQQKKIDYSRQKEEMLEQLIREKMERDRKDGED